jgi:hypothetical protein
VTGCTLSGNSAADAGGIVNEGTLSVTGCTLSGNSAFTGGGIDNLATLKLDSSIVAGNSAPTDADIRGTVTSQGFNLVQSPGDSSGYLSSDQLGVNPLLSAPGNYGGPTQTFALLPGSPAIAHGDPSLATAGATDQRGQPRSVAGHVDVGAYQTQANPFLVTTTADPGQLFGVLSLREAVNLANAYASAGDAATITFAPGISSITLAGSQLELSGHNATTAATITIAGGTAGVTVDGNNTSRVLQVDNGVSAALSGLTIAHGKVAAPADGGGISNAGTLTVTGCTLSGNSASFGGGIDNEGTLSVTGCTLSGNSATIGDGIYSNGTLTVTGCTFSGNSGGFDGGGIYNLGTLTVTGCTFSGNLTGAGGGICNEGTASVTGCTLSSNTAFDGGGIFNGGTLTVTDCTLSGNSANDAGGGIFSYNAHGCTLSVIGCTLSGNSAINAGGGIDNASGSTLTLDSSIVAGNNAPTDLDIQGTVTSQGFNLVQSPGDSSGYVSSDQLNVDPLLSKLGNYGGPTQTFALLPASPALAHGDPSLATAGATDQRGQARSVAGHVDVGAYQTQANPFLVTTAADPGQLSGVLSLREAVNLANAYASAGDAATISFAQGISSITLAGSQLELSGHNATTAATITIAGGTAGVTVDGNNASRVFLVDSGVGAALAGLTIAHGKVPIGIEGSGIYNAGTLSVTGCTLSDNSASYGAIYNHSGSTLSVTGCTLSGNTATFGGGIRNDGTLSLTGSTLSGNLGGFGGGIQNTGTLSVTGCTLSGNSAAQGGGIINFGTLNLDSSIVAGNNAPTDPDISGPVTSQGFNLVQSPGASSGYISSDQLNVNPLLSALGYYGGPTQTFALLPGSPALAHGDASLATAGATDQRGQPRSVAGHVDVGAYQTQANPFLVTTTADPGQLSGVLSLREAVNLANAYAGAGDAATITFAQGISSITLAGSQLELSGHNATTQATITIAGGTAGVTVDGNNASRVFLVDSGVGAALAGLTIAHGKVFGFTVAGEGGGINNDGTLGVTGCTLSGNSASFGGGINNNGTMSVTGCTLSGNSVSDGGGINNAGTMRVTGCTLSGNTAVAFGGGIFNNVSGTLSVTGSTLSGNSVGASFGGGSGGGIDNAGTVSVTDCTLSANSASRGGGIFNNFGTVSVTACTLSGNSGGGIDNLDTLKLDSSIVADGIQGTVTSQGFNLVQSPGASSGYISSDQLNVNPLLSALGYYGGPTQTFALLPGSPALVHGDASLATPGATDQRGQPRSVAGHVDAGAYQTQANPFLVTTTADPGLLSGVLSLREAVNLANAYASAGDAATISFAQGLSSITLAGSQLELSGHNATTPGTITIAGGTAGVTVDGNNTSRVLQVDSGVSAALAGLTIAHGKVVADYGGGISNAGTLSVTGCTLSGNFASVGGGISNTGTLSVTGSTLSGNLAPLYGGGIYNNIGSTLSVTGSTLSGNGATYFGGGIFNNGGTLSVTGCTLSGNGATYGGGIYNAGTLMLDSSIVAGNNALADPDIQGTVTSQGFNLVQSPGDRSGYLSSDQLNVNPLLSALGYYGGPTQTFALLPGSPAIAHGDASLATPGATDQRGQPRSFGGHVDVGAFESQGFTIAVTSGGGQATNIATAFSAPLVVTVTANNPSEPVAGGLVTFTSPSSGASATISGSPATISAAGTASVTATANGFAGSYTVSATARGIATPASVSLSNRPTLTVPAPQTAYENVDQTISGISIGDAPGATLTVTLSVGHGTLTLGTTNGLTVTGNGSGSVTLSGTTTNLNAALASLVYRGSHDYSGGDTLSLTAADSGVSATPASVALTVVSIAQQATNLQAQVSALQSAGVLSQGQANSLISKLNLTGNSSDIGKVQAFLNAVQTDLSAGILTQAQANILLYWGNILLLGVTRR